MTDPYEHLRRQFIARCRSELEQLRELALDDPELGRIAHRLTGSAGTFGYPQVSEAAAVVDDRARYAGAPSPDEIQALVEALETAITRDPARKAD